MKNKETQSVSLEILDKIKKGEVKMKSKEYFFLKGALLVVFFIVIFILTIFLMSFVAFTLKVNNFYDLPRFGPTGIWIFFKSLPWLLILLVLGMAFVLEILGKNFKFIYKRPLFYSMLGIVAVILIVGFIIAETEIHERVYNKMQNKPIPFAGPVYKHYGNNLPTGIHIGMIVEKHEDGFTIRPARSTTTVRVTTNSETTLPLNILFKEGDKILIAGEYFDGTIHAHGVKHLKPIRIAQ